MKEKPYRSLIKAISWRISASLLTIKIVYIFTKELLLSFGVGAVEVMSKLIFYYFHERIWNKISFGKIDE